MKRTERKPARRYGEQRKTGVRAAERQLRGNQRRGQPGLRLFCAVQRGVCAETGKKTAEAAATAGGTPAVRRAGGGGEGLRTADRTTEVRHGQPGSLPASHDIYGRSLTENHGVSPLSQPSHPEPTP